MKGEGDTLVIASLALAVYRNPARHAELMRGDLPSLPGMANLLRLAGGTDPREIDAALTNLAPVDELREAASFFIEQVLFHRDADHYRVLGLNADASLEQIKEHHRLLMRLFHPDRSAIRGENRVAFATRANLAYKTLRDVDARAAYDVVRKTAAAPAARRPPVAPVRRRMPPQPESWWSVRLQPFVMRHLPQFVLAGTALIAVSVVGGIYVLNPPLHLRQAEGAVSRSPEEPTLRPAPQGHAGTDAVTAREAVMGANDRTKTAQAVTSAPLATEASADALGFFGRQIPDKSLPRPRIPGHDEATVTKTKPASRELQPAPLPREAAALRVLADTHATTSAESRLPERVPAAAATMPGLPTPPLPAAYVAEAPVRQAVPVTPAEPMPDPNSLLARFLAAYERGDMQTCMTLLDEGLRADAGGKSELRQEYDTLFRSTDLRHVKVSGMSWSQDGEVIRGEGHYRATFMRKGETLLRSHEGVVRVEVVRRGNAALISELRYVVGGRT